MVKQREWTKHTLDADLTYVAPDPMTVTPNASSARIATREVRRDYFDTADRALAGVGVRLLRRSGAHNARWELTFPKAVVSGSSRRQRLRADDAGDSVVPAEWDGLLLGLRRGQPLSTTATVATHATRTRCHNNQGQLLVQLTDSTNQAASVGDAATLTRWRTIDIAGARGRRSHSQALYEQALTAGARPRQGNSPLEQALADPDHASPDRTRSPRAGQVISAYLAEQQLALVGGDLRLRAGDDTAIHPTRVASRRIRSTLRVFGDLFDAAPAAALDDELRWYAELLGAVRDRQVLQRRLDAMIEEVDPTLLLGPVRDRLDGQLTRERTEQWDALIAALSEPRYLSLLAAVADLVERPPYTSRASRPAKALAPYVRKAERTVRNRLARAIKDDDLDVLHAARKSAKRARYAVEATAAALDDHQGARQAHRRYRRLQDLLGEHQDSVVSAAFLRRLGAAAGTAAGENGFAFGLLYEREQERARDARAEARAALKKLT
jgi:CHAD domain-containing protein